MAKDKTPEKGKGKGKHPGEEAGKDAHIPPGKDKTGKDKADPTQTVEALQKQVEELRTANKGYINRLMHTSQILNAEVYGKITDDFRLNRKSYDILRLVINTCADFSKKQPHFGEN